MNLRTGLSHAGLFWKYVSVFSWVNTYQTARGSFTKQDMVKVGLTLTVFQSGHIILYSHQQCMKVVIALHLHQH